MKRTIKEKKQFLKNKVALTPAVSHHEVRILKYSNPTKFHREKRILLDLLCSLETISSLQ